MMRYSEQYHKRKQYQQLLLVPSFTEARCQLGDDLADVLLTNCPDSLQHEMHLTPALDGPGQNLWISPSDLLIGKVVLKPPLTAKHTKALAHEGILHIGEVIEAQWLAAVELEKKRALEDLEELLMLLAERDKERALAAALAERDREFAEQIARLNAEFEEMLRAELDALEASLREYYEALIEEKVRECMEDQAANLQAKIDEAVAAAVLELSAKFMLDMQEQEHELETMYNARLEGQHERFLEELQCQEDAFVVVMQQLKHHLQCNTISSLMYVMCMERRKCLQEQQHVIHTTRAQLAEMQANRESDREEMATLRAQLEKAQRQATIREDCLLGVITQFQKFINHALNAAPTQAEFLLSIEKMMTFELCQAMLRTDRGKRTHLARMVMPWRPISRELLSRPPSMTIATHHDCLNEAPMPRCPKEGSEVDLRDLYAVNYKERVYVREDFRNRIEQGFVTRPSGMLWSKEIQDLITLITTANEAEIQTHPNVRSPSLRSAGLSVASSVRFERDSFPDRDTAGLLAVRDSVALQKSRLSQSFGSGIPPAFCDEEDQEPMKQRSSLGVALLATTDSVTLMKEKHVGTSGGNSEYVITNAVCLQPEVGTPPFGSLESVRIVQAPPLASIKLSKVVVTREDSLDAAADEYLKLTKNAEGTPTPVHQTTNIRPVKKPHQNLPMRCASRITQHRDSFELISRSRHPSTIKMIKNLVTQTDALDDEYPTQQVVINAPESSGFGGVDFKRVAEVFNDLYRPDKPWMVYEKQERLAKRKVPRKSQEKASAAEPPPIPPQPTNFLKKKNRAKVLGETFSEVNTTRKDFVVHRIHSLVDILKKDDSLIRMFTRCQQ